MRPIALFSLTFAAAALLGFGPARAAAPATDSCFAGCTAPGLSADDQATCRLQCARLAQSTPASPPAAKPPAAAPPSSSTPASPPAAKPPAATPPSTPPASSPPAASPPRPAQPASQPAPDLAHQKFLCESQCDNEPNPGDRATCRLQCNQLNRASAPQPTSAPVGSTTVGSTTTYSFAPGGGSVPVTTSPGTSPAYRPAQPGSTAATYNPQAAQQQQVAACQATCDREASATDRATCRNNCGAVGTVVGPAAPSQWVLGPAPTMTEAEQRAAVIRSSNGVVPGSAPGGAPRPVAVPTSQPAAPAQATVTALPGQQPQNPHCAAHAQSCKVGCASEQTTCGAQCDQGKMSETDRATCKLTCSSSGDMCRDDCRMKEAACKPAVYR
ncbi:hypothetical protein OV203_37240 [Nannocystis sp. ILAH1]|uniref:hypothetical protein n=1 Tax=unclassified Nannocystis TaxID=2627009 RepID=UPI00226EB538|nr:MULTISPECIES: hypothetical protein [unclassified Nannocystis]MCY0992846.1 hypothetical protein [Nannocystis sp. ILAH1]MCY1066316.1 hypothetical protein [Nannocystis sp. RBIL2]